MLEDWKMNIPERKIIFIDLTRQSPVREEYIQTDAARFHVQEHRIGWDFETAEMMIRTYDGYADAIALGGIYKHIGFEDFKIHHPGYLRLLRAATKTPVYVGGDLRSFFAQWTIKKLLQDHPQVFFRKKVLFQCALITSILPQIVEAGGEIIAADPLIAGIPVLLRGMAQVKTLFKTCKPFIRHLLFNRVQPIPSSHHREVPKTLKKAIQESDILVGFANILSVFDTYEILAGKIIIVDHIDSSTRSRLEAAGVDQIIEFIPKQSRKNLPHINEFPVLEAIIDQTRILENSSLHLEDYFLKWMEKIDFSRRPVRSHKGFPRKCAFIIHALTQKDYWKVPALKPLKHAPPSVRNLFEKGASYAPCFYMGKLTGVVSDATGQEVECDFYAMPATPRQILGMDEEFLYRRLVQCAETAKARGAGLVGLGAYTKVAGDAGVTVARQSSVPITNGNSYSAATTLWAARQMVEKMGLISPEKIGNRFKAKAMIIGATGSIGRVSSLLVSLVFQEVILVANRVDKLIELREEVMKLSPGIKVTLCTQSHLEISDADLIVTATSNQSGSVLDIDLVKPGAVICDCSRPLDITAEEVAKRPDVLVIESGEVILPGNPQLDFDMGLPYPSVYACTAETVLLALEGRFESFSLSKQLSLEKTKEIYKLGMKHGARLSAIQGPLGLVTPQVIENCRALALERLKYWKLPTSRQSMPSVI
jgi:predicted amino acid dehydrogenase